MKALLHIVFAALIWGLLGSFNLIAPQPYSDFESGPKAEESWVDSLAATLSLEEKIGQLFTLRAYSNKDERHTRDIESLIRNHHIGGLCFFQGEPVKEAELTNQFQSISKVPLLISIDGEWGLGMRLKASTISFPKQLTLGAIQSNKLIYEMGEEVARHCKRIGIHMNYGPVADINNNPNNPVISFRSFGEDRKNVAIKSYMYMLGMQDHGVLACAKHFPGHGDTDVDSHLDLPIIPFDRGRLDSLELYPFKILAEQGVAGMMIGHLEVPALEPRDNRATSLSQKTITALLKNEMGFKGLVITDGLGMKGVTKHFESGVVEAEALVAGNDILLLPENVPASVRMIKKYLDEGKYTLAQLDESVKKILRAKYRVGLNAVKPIEMPQIDSDLNHPRGIALKRKLYQHALTVLKNEDSMLPLINISKLEAATLSLGADQPTDFQLGMNRFAALNHYQLGSQPDKKRRKLIMESLAKKDIVIVGVHSSSNYASKNYGVSQDMMNFVKELEQKTKVLVVFFGTPYGLKYFENSRNLVAAYEADPLMEDVAGQAIFGATSMTGKLPVSVSPKLALGDGMVINKTGIIGYSIPEEVGLSSDYLGHIDTMIWNAIHKGGTPGATILVVKDGKSIYQKAYGHHTYEKQQAVRTTDLFDLASITKVAATTLSIMKLVDEGKIDVEKPASDYLPALKNTNKKDLTIREMMTHQAGLTAWIPFYTSTISMENNKAIWNADIYSDNRKRPFLIPVAQNMFMHEEYVDTLWNKIYQSELRASKEYKYSDLGFYLMGKIVEVQTGKTLDRYVKETFYEPMGLASTTFNPLERFDINTILPTEEDQYFRNKRIQGHVHDMGAAMLGGVAGHAGLFSNAADLAKIFQMLLNQGIYNGKRYLSPATIKLFTSKDPWSTRRGLGFDMLETSPDKEPNISPMVSTSTFGHYGFTGTGVWADPERGLIYIILANRTYPSMDNKKFTQTDVRSRSQTMVYEAFAVRN